VANLTAKRAIDQLVAEGRLTSHRGVGAFVRVRKHSSQILRTAPRSVSSWNEKA
jgi:DNA-binding GntR family transcriptional regulator